MGGIPPLGYEPYGRSLKIVEPHAELVRDIFQQYLRLGNVRLVAEELERDGVMAPQRHTSTGKTIGGCALSRGQIYKLLSNPIYIAIIEHHGQRYPALHKPIIDMETWERVQAKLSENLQGKRTRTYARNPSLLAGKIFDAAGERMLPVHANKQSQRGAAPLRYRYYVSQPLHEGRSNDGWRVPAREVEAVVAERLAKVFDDPIGLFTFTELPSHADRLANLDQRAREMAVVVRQRGHASIAALVDQVRLEDGRIVITCSSSALCEALRLPSQPSAAKIIELFAEVRLTRSGKAMRLIDGNGQTTGATPDRSLLRQVLQARKWWAELRKGELNITQLAEREGVQDAWITRVVRLAFLSPEIVDAIVRGDHPTSLSSNKVIIGLELAPAWAAQRILLSS